MRYSHQTEQSHCHCLPLGFRSVRRGHTRNGSVVERLLVGWSCAVFGMEGGGGGGGGDDGSEGNGGRGEAFSEEEVRGSSESSESSVSTSVRESLSSGGFEEPAKSLVSDVGGDGEKAGQVVKPKISDMEMMKERFSKLLLGEDMSGCGNGVSTALAISNSITNLCATIFGQLWRLEPVSPIKKCMWRREMDWLLCVSDHIVELVPSWQTFPDGSKLEIMTCRPRTDLYINLPALRKLDNMLLEILDEFKDPEFWYVDQGVLAPEIDGSASFRRSLKHQEEKWWLPVPRVPSGGLKSKTRKLLQDKRECTNQILKAALAINSNALVEMEVPESYINSLPKNGRASLGDIMYRYIISDQFFPECLLDCLCLSSEYHALEIANRVEASIYIWRRGIATNTKSSWGMVKDMVLDAEKRELLADRAEGLLLCLKQRFPGLTQTALDTSKIQFNKDVGKSILESYSRVLESLAFNIVARIDDLLHVDDLAKHLDQAVGAITYNRVSNPQSVPVSSTPYSTAYATPNFSPAPLISPARTSLIRRKSHSQGFRVKKALTDYLGIDTKAKHDNNISEVSVSIQE